MSAKADVLLAAKGGEDIWEAEGGELDFKWHLEAENEGGGEAGAVRLVEASADEEAAEQGQTRMGGLGAVAGAPDVWDPEEMSLSSGGVSRVAAVSESRDVRVFGEALTMAVGGRERSGGCSGFDSGSPVAVENASSLLPGEALPPDDSRIQIKGSFFAENAVDASTAPLVAGSLSVLVQPHEEVPPSALGAPLHSPGHGLLQSGFLQPSAKPGHWRGGDGDGGHDADAPGEGLLVMPGSPDVGGGGLLQKPWEWQGTMRDSSVPRVEKPSVLPWTSFVLSDRSSHNGAAGEAIAPAVGQRQAEVKSVGVETQGDPPQAGLGSVAEAPEQALKGSVIGNIFRSENQKQTQHEVLDSVVGQNALQSGDRGDWSMRRVTRGQKVFQEAHLEGHAARGRVKATDGEQFLTCQGSAANGKGGDEEEGVDSEGGMAASKHEGLEAGADGVEGEVEGDTDEDEGDEEEAEGVRAEAADNANGRQDDLPEVEISVARTPSSVSLRPRRSMRQAGPSREVQVKGTGPTAPGRSPAKSRWACKQRRTWGSAGLGLRGLTWADNSCSSTCSSLGTSTSGVAADATEGPPNGESVVLEEGISPARRRTVDMRASAKRASALWAQSRRTPWTGSRGGKPLGVGESPRKSGALGRPPHSNGRVMSFRSRRWLSKSVAAKLSGPWSVVEAKLAQLVWPVEARAAAGLAGSGSPAGLKVSRAVAALKLAPAVAEDFSLPRGLTWMIMQRCQHKQKKRSSSSKRSPGTVRRVPGRSSSLPARTAFKALDDVGQKGAEALRPVKQEFGIGQREGGPQTLAAGVSTRARSRCLSLEKVKAEGKPTSHVQRDRQTEQSNMAMEKGKSGEKGRPGEKGGAEVAEAGLGAGFDSQAGAESARWKVTGRRRTNSWRANASGQSSPQGAHYTGYGSPQGSQPEHAPQQSGGGSTLSGVQRGSRRVMGGARAKEGLDPLLAACLPWELVAACERVRQARRQRLREQAQRPAGEKQPDVAEQECPAVARRESPAPAAPARAWAPVAVVPAAASISASAPAPATATAPLAPAAPIPAAMQRPRRQSVPPHLQRKPVVSGALALQDHARQAQALREARQAENKIRAEEKSVPDVGMKRVSSESTEEKLLALARGTQPPSPKGKEIVRTEEKEQEGAGKRSKPRAGSVRARQGIVGGGVEEGEGLSSGTATGAGRGAQRQRSPAAAAAAIRGLLAFEAAAAATSLILLSPARQLSGTVEQAKACDVLATESGGTLRASAPPSLPCPSCREAEGSRGVHEAAAPCTACSKIRRRASGQKPAGKPRARAPRANSEDLAAGVSVDRDMAAQVLAGLPLRLEEGGAGLRSSAPAFGGPVSAAHKPEEHALPGRRGPAAGVTPAAKKARRAPTANGDRAKPARRKQAGFDQLCAQVEELTRENAALKNSVDAARQHWERLLEWQSSLEAQLAGSNAAEAPSGGPPVASGNEAEEQETELQLGSRSSSGGGGALGAQEENGLPKPGGFLYSLVEHGCGGEEGQGPAPGIAGLVNACGDLERGRAEVGCSGGLAATSHMQGQGAGEPEAGSQNWLLGPELSEAEASNPRLVAKVGPSWLGVGPGRPMIPPFPLPPSWGPVSRSSELLPQPYLWPLGTQVYSPLGPGQLQSERQQTHPGQHGTGHAATPFPFPSHLPGSAPALATTPHLRSSFPRPGGPSASPPPPPADGTTMAAAASAAVAAGATLTFGPGLHSSVHASSVARPGGGSDWVLGGLPCGSSASGLRSSGGSSLTLDLRLTPSYDVGRSPVPQAAGPDGSRQPLLSGDGLSGTSTEENELRSAHTVAPEQVPGASLFSLSGEGGPDVELCLDNSRGLEGDAVGSQAVSRARSSMEEHQASPRLLKLLPSAPSETNMMEAAQGPNAPATPSGMARMPRPLSDMASLPAAGAGALQGDAAAPGLSFGGARANSHLEDERQEPRRAVLTFPQPPMSAYKDRSPHVVLGLRPPSPPIPGAALPHPSGSQGLRPQSVPDEGPGRSRRLSALQAAREVQHQQHGKTGQAAGGSRTGGGSPRALQTLGQRKTTPGKGSRQASPIQPLDVQVGGRLMAGTPWPIDKPGVGVPSGMVGHVPLSSGEQCPNASISLVSGTGASEEVVSGRGQEGNIPEGAVQGVRGGAPKLIPASLMLPKGHIPAPQGSVPFLHALSPPGLLLGQSFFPPVGPGFFPPPPQSAAAPGLAMPLYPLPFPHPAPRSGPPGAGAQPSAARNPGGVQSGAVVRPVPNRRPLPELVQSSAAGTGPATGLGAGISAQGETSEGQLHAAAHVSQGGGASGPTADGAPALRLPVSSSGPAARQAVARDPLVDKASEAHLTLQPCRNSPGDQGPLSAVKAGPTALVPGPGGQPRAAQGRPVLSAAAEARRRRKEATKGKSAVRPMLPPITMPGPLAGSSGGKGARPLGTSAPSSGVSFPLGGIKLVVPSEIPRSTPALSMGNGVRNEMTNSAQVRNTSSLQPPAPSFGPSLRLAPSQEAHLSGPEESRTARSGDGAHPGKT